MAGPWEDYQKTEEKSAGPWQDYQRPTSPKAKVEPKVEADKPAPEKSRLAKALDFSPYAGLIDSSLHMGSGMIAGPVSDIAGLGAMAKDTITGNKDGDPVGFKRHVQDSLTYKPRTTAGELMSEYNPVTIGMKGVAKVADATGEAIGGGAAADTFRGGAGNLVSESIKQGAGLATAKAAPYIPKAGRAIKEAAGKVAEKVPMGIKLTPEMAELNASAKQMGITLAPHQLSGNKYIQIAGSEVGNVPLSGAKNAANQIAWERALIKRIGGDAKAEHLTSKVYENAMRQSGTTIDRIMGRNKLTISDGLKKKLDELKSQAETKETPANERIFDGEVSDLFSRAEGIEKKASPQIVGPDGKPISSGVKKPAVVNGIAFRKFNSSLSKRIRETTDGDTRRLLSDFQDALLEEFNDGITNKADVSALKQARMQYAIGKDIAPIVGKPKGVNPQALRAQIRNTKFKKELYANGKSSLKDLADIGDLLKDPSTSNTIERGIALSALGGAGLASLPAAAGLYGAANVYNRFGHLMIPEAPKK